MKIVDLFQASIKQMISISAENSFVRVEIRLSVKCSANKKTRCVLSVLKLSKLDHVIYGAAKVNRGFKKDKFTLSTNLNSTLSPKTSNPKLLRIKEDLSINNHTNFFGRILFNEET